MFIFQAEGPTVRDLKVRYATGKKTTKSKKKMDKAMKVLTVLLLLILQYHDLYRYILQLNELS